jgi:endonuclease YncB( thermonuclease family)
MRGRLVALLLGLAASLAAEPLTWNLGQVEARLLAAGYTRDPVRNVWEAELELRLYNRDSRRRFNQLLVVEFLDAAGTLERWKSFVNLAPGTAQHRRLRAPRRLACRGELAACPPLRARVSLKVKDEKAFLATLPLQAISEPEAPPAEKELWAARVYDGDTFELMDGSKIRLLGIDTPELRDREGRFKPEPLAREAADFTRARVMSGPLRLTYDGERRDAYGRWLAQVTLADGSDLNAELLRRGLARVYERSQAARLEDYKKIEAQARKRGLGLWKQADQAN